MTACQVVVLLVGVAIGYVVGVATTLLLLRHHHVTREVAVQLRRDAMGWLERINQWVTHWLALILVAIFIVTGYSIHKGSSQHSADESKIRGLVTAQGDQNTCLTQFANRLYDSLSPRQKASESLQRADNAFNDALVALLKDSLTSGTTMGQQLSDAEQLQAAAQHKQDVAAHLNAERAHNPYPSPPRKACPS